MKNRSKITAAITAILLMAVAAGCKHNALGTLEDIETRKPEVNVYTKIKGTVTNYSEIIIDKVTKPVNASVAGARTIAPALKTADYKFFLWGQNGASFCGPFDLSGELTGNGGSFECSVPTGIWNLSLVAFDKDQKFGASKDQDAPSREECLTNTGDTAIENIALLMGRAYVDLTANLDSQKVNFVLSPEGLATEGNVSFNIVLDGWKSADRSTNLTAKAGIYNLKTGEAISYGEGENAKSTEHAITFAAAGASAAGKDGTAIAAGAETALYEVVTEDSKPVDLPPGTYSFVLQFNDTKTKKTWVWTDQIMIFPGISVNKTVFVPELIFEKPKTPEFLYASVVKGTDHNDSDLSVYKPVTDDSGRLYQVVFEWADWDNTGTAINNERYFELQLADVTGIKDDEIADATTAGSEKADKFWLDFEEGDGEDKTHTPYVAYTKEVLKLDSNKKYTYDGAADNTLNWKLVVEDKKFNDDTDDLTINVARYSTDVFSKIPTYVSGSLNANNKSVTLFLELGKEYIARIAAVNDTDRSDWTYCALTPVAVHTAAGAESTETPTLSGIKFKGKTINNYYIRYMLNDGEATSVKGNYVEYYGPATAEGTKFTDFYGKGLARGGVKVTGWKDGPESNAQDYYISKPTKATTTYGEAETGTPPYTKKIKKTVEQTSYNGTKIKKEVNLYTKATSPTAPTDEAPDETTSNWVTITTDPPKTTIESAGDDSMITYAHGENLTLWAQYSKEFTWNFITNYDLDPSWVKYQVVKSDKTAITGDTNVASFKEYDDGGTTIGGNLSTGAYKAEYHPQIGKDYNKIKWSIKVPSETRWNYRYAKVIINRSDKANSTVTLAEVDTSDVGTATELYTDVSDLVQGTYYNVLIEMGLPNSALTTTLPVVLYVR